MKIAVTYDNGNVFQHFGRTEAFKVYTVEDGKVVSAEVMGSNGTGHGALAGLLADHGIDVLICGGIGPGARNALEAAGVELRSGAEGSSDEAVEAYLRGELVSDDANCDHHGDHDHECCGEHDHGEDHECCGGHGHDHEGGCCGGHDQEGEGCCGREPAGKNDGKKVRVHYRGTLNDGTQFDSSYDRGEPLEFVCGAGMMIRGFDAAVMDMEVGEIVDVHLMPEEAYGMTDPRNIFSVEIAQLPGSEGLEKGQSVYLQDRYGRPIPATVTDKDETTITFDTNHPMAGKELNFRIELVEVL